MPWPRSELPELGATAGGGLQQRIQRICVSVRAEKAPRCLGSVRRSLVNCAAQPSQASLRRRRAARASSVATNRPGTRQIGSVQRRHTTRASNCPPRNWQTKNTAPRRLRRPINPAGAVARSLKAAMSLMHVFTHPKPSVHLLHSTDSRGGANLLRRWSPRENCSRLRTSSRCSQRAAAAISRSARRTASSREACAERASSSKAFLASSAAPAGTSAPHGGGHTRVRPPRPSSIHTSARRSIAAPLRYRRLQGNAPATGGPKRAAEAQTSFSRSTTAIKGPQTTRRGASKVLPLPGPAATVVL